MSRARSKLALWIYVAAVIAAAGAALAWGLLHFDQAIDVWVLLLFVGLAMVMELMVVPLAEGGGVAASFAAYFAGLLVLGPVGTASVAALVGMSADGIVRRVRLVRACFNASHSALSLLAAGWVYQKLGGVVLEEFRRGVPAGGGRGTPPYWLAVIGAGICLWAMETVWVALAVTLERGRRRQVPMVIRWLRSSLAPMLALDGALASVGLLLALLYQSRAALAGTAGWQGTALLAVIAVIPSALLYYAYRLQGHLQRAYANSLRALGALVEAKVGAPGTSGPQGSHSGFPRGHAGQVADLAATLAQALDTPSIQVEQIRYAGFLHDIGKVGMPSSVLARSRDQFVGESDLVRTSRTPWSGEPRDSLRIPEGLHPQIGGHILAPIRFLGPAAQMVRSHRERWDGLGYPDGLRGQQIPLGARLLSLADAYVGMSGPLSPAQALSRLRQAAGSRFDPELVEALASVCDSGGAQPTRPGRRRRNTPCACPAAHPR